MTEAKTTGATKPSGWAHLKRYDTRALSIAWTAIMGVSLAWTLYAQQQTMTLSIAWYGAFWILGFGGISVFRRHRAKQAFQEQSRQTLEKILESLPVGVVIIGKDKVVRQANSTALAMMGYESPNGILGHQCHEAFCPARKHACPILDMGQDVDNAERVLITKDRMKIPVLKNVVPITLNGEEVLLETFADISDRKRAEEALAESESRFQQIAANSQELLWMTSADGRDIIYVSPAYETIFGRSREHLDRDPADWGNAVHPEDRERVQAVLYEQALSGPQKDTYRIVRPDGSIRWVEGPTFPIKNDAGEVYRLAGTVHDITSRKQVEEELLRSETKFRTLYNSTSDAVMLLDEKGFFDCNEATVRIFGCKDKAEFCAKHPSDLSPLCQPCGTDSTTLANRRIATAMEEGTYRFEWMHKRLDTGADFPVEVLLNALELDGKQVLQAVVRDISDRKHAERALEVAQEEAETANRAKSQFLASMSHELRTPLTGILGFTDLLLNAATDEPQRDEYLKTIRASGRHLLELINDILDLSKIQAEQLDVELAPCRPHAILNDVVSLMRAQAQSKGLDLGFRWSSPVPAVAVTDGARLRQILLNLVGNAVKFSEQGRVDVVARLEPSREGHTLLVDVIDTGIGIPDEKLHSIFDPFVQADNSVTRQFGGTGLGLAISIRLARALGGDIAVTSELGVGSTFTVSVEAGKLEGVEMLSSPPADCAGAGQDEKVFLPASRFHPGNVLLVEDGETNRKLISTVLERAGLRVSTAENGMIGVDLAAENHFDLILMDMQMPVLGGYAAARELRSLGCDTPIVALTAHATKRDEDKCLTAGCSHYVSKPIDIESLLATVADVLGWKENRTDCVTSTLPSDSGLPPLVSSLPMEDPVFREIAQEFVEYLDQLLTEMRQAASNKDVSHLREIAHSLKGSAGTAGFDAFTKPARRLEMLAKQEQMDAIGPAIHDLTHLAERIVVPAETRDAAS